MSTTRTSPTYTYAGLSFHFEVTWTEAENSLRYKCKVVPTTSGKEFNKEVKQGLKIMASTGRALVDVEGTRVTQTKPCSWAERTIQSSTAVVQIYAGDISWENIYSTTVQVPTPTKCEAKKINNGKYEITVTGQGSAKYPASQVHIERSENGGSYSELTGSPVVPSNITGSYTVTFTDQTTTTNAKYVWRAYVSNSYGDSGYAYSNGQYTQPTTNATIEVKEVGGIRLLQWDIDDVAGVNNGTVKGWIVQVEENGTGIFLPIGIVPATPLIYRYTWIHIPIAGTTSRYRLLAFGQGGTAIAGGSATDSWTAPPTKPQGVTAYRTPEVNVVIDIKDRSSNTADEVHIERNIDGEGWEEISVQQFPVTQYVDTTVIGNSSVEYRVRNSNSKGFTDYVGTGIVPLLSQPNPPSLIEPYNNSIGIIDDNSITLVFQHNPTDGTPQVEAELQYRTGDEWTTISLQDEPSYEIDLQEFDVNDVIEWRARTHGNYNVDGVWVWSEWSEVYSITLLRKPQITITSPLNTEPISELPIILGYAYQDDSGTLTDLTVEIVRNGEVEATYKPDVGDGTTGTYTYPLTGFLFDNNENYEIIVSALSSTGLTTNDSVAIYIDYAETSDEGALIPTFIGDQETGIVNIQLTQDMTEDVEVKNVVEAYLYRNHEGVRTLVGSALQGELIVDKYAPLNVTYSYELLMLTDESEVILTRYDYELDSIYSFIYFGDEIFKGKWNPEFDVTFDRPERVEKRYSGREYPVSYDSNAIEESCRYGTVLTEREDVVQLKSMMRKGNGQGIWKSADGDSYMANFVVSYQTNRYYRKQVWNVSLDVKRIDDGNSNR